MVKNRLMSLLVVALALGVSATSVFAQNQGGGRGGRGGFGGFGGGPRDVLSLIGNEAVVKELALSDEVAGKLKTVSDESRAELRKAFGDSPLGRDASDAERAERRKKTEETSKAVREKYLPKVKEILTPAQYERVQQIAWQASGVGAYADPEVAKALALTQEQQDKIAAINKAAGEKTRALFTGGAGGEGNREKMQEINKTRETEIAAVLTAEQSAKWTTLKGKEFDTAKLRPMGRGPRGAAGGRPATE